MAGTGVPAADMGAPPACRCHGAPQWWSKEARLPAGGRWRCSIRRTEVQRRSYRLSQGVDIEDEEERRLFEYQDGACYLCGHRMKADEIHLDHDHATKLPRGLAHSTCNRAVGMLGDDPTMLRRVADALEDPPWRRLMGCYLDVTQLEAP